MANTGPTTAEVTIQIVNHTGIVEVGVDVTLDKGEAEAIGITGTQGSPVTYCSFVVTKGNKNVLRAGHCVSNGDYCVTSGDAH